MIGIKGYGSWVSPYFLEKKGKVKEELGLLEQRIAHPYDDTVTICHKAAEEAILDAGIKKEDIKAIYSCQESKT